jgi:hypothetical protein
MRAKFSLKAWLLVAIFLLPILTIRLAADVISSLAISGQQGSAKVVQMNGKNYVEVEGLARITNSSISFAGNQIILSLGTGTTPASNDGFSRDFRTQGIEALSQIREWHSAFRTAIERGLPITADWLTPYRNQAQEAVRLTGVAVSLPADKNALPLLSSQLDTMNRLTDKYLTIADNRENIRTDALVNDALEQKVRNCGRALASMVSSNQFSDDGACTVPVPGP